MSPVVLFTHLWSEGKGTRANMNAITDVAVSNGYSVHLWCGNNRDVCYFSDSSFAMIASVIWRVRALPPRSGVSTFPSPVVALMAA